MLFSHQSFAIEMVDETYPLNGGKPARPYSLRYNLEGAGDPYCKHGVYCFEQDVEGASALVIAGGVTTVHERACIVLEDRCLVAVGCRIACLALPSLQLLWNVEVDLATCFGLYLLAERQDLVVHGELGISRWTADGQRLWSFLAGEVLSEGFILNPDTVTVTDFNQRRFSIDLETGESSILEDAR